LRSQHPDAALRGELRRQRLAFRHDLVVAQTSIDPGMRTQPRQLRDCLFQRIPVRADPISGNHSQIGAQRRVCP
jgi:hypothetical protein